MSQRNFQNDRYTREDRSGVTRKSAASAKPKRAAAASVHVQSSEKTPQQKKQERKAREKENRQKQKDLERKYYSPPTEEYKKLRRIWWGLVIAAIIFMMASFFGRELFGDVFAFVSIGLAYACIIGALYVDFGKTRKVRQKYAAEQEALKSKAMRAEEKKARSDARALKKNAQETYDQAKAEQAAKKKGLSGLFSKKHDASSKETSGEKTGEKVEV